MTMTFFFNVTDTGKAIAVVQNPVSCSDDDILPPGSWLQIGQSISHFCITSLLLVFSAGIASVGETLMRGAVPRRPEGKREE